MSPFLQNRLQPPLSAPVYPSLPDLRARDHFEKHTGEAHQLVLNLWLGQPVAYKFNNSWFVRVVPVEIIPASKDQAECLVAKVWKFCATAEKQSWEREWPPYGIAVYPRAIDAAGYASRGKWSVIAGPHEIVPGAVGYLGLDSYDPIESPSFLTIESIQGCVNLNEVRKREGEKGQAFCDLARSYRRWVTILAESAIQEMNHRKCTELRYEYFEKQSVQVDTLKRCGARQRLTATFDDDNRTLVLNKAKVVGVATPVARN